MSSWSLQLLLLVVLLLPPATIFRSPRWRRPRAAAFGASGLLLILVGTVSAGQDGFLDLRLAWISWRILVQSPLAVAPVGLIVVGVAALLIGLGMAVSRLLALRSGVIGSALVGVWFAGSMLAASGLLSSTRGGSVGSGPLLVAVAFAVAAVLALVALSRLGRWAGPAPRKVPRAVLVVAGLSVAVGIGVWIRIEAAPRLVVAEVFPDQAFASCVATGLGRDDASAMVSVSDLDDVRSLDCNGDLAVTPGRIFSIEGTQRLPNLASLNLSSNAVADLSPLTGLQKLGSLTLTHNQIVDLGPLTGLPVLTDLGASDNHIADLRPLASVPTLRTLGLSQNQLTDLGPLAGLTALSSLTVDRNAVVDLDALAGLLQLDELTLSDNRIADPSPLAGLTALSRLDISGNEIADAALLADLSSVQELWIGGNPITDLRPLLAMPSLIGVDLEGADPATVVGIEELRDSGVYVGGLA